MQDRDTLSVLQREVGKEKTRRVHQIDDTHYVFDFSNVKCLDDAEQHVVRLHFTCNVSEFVHHIKCLTKPQLL